MAGRMRRALDVYETPAELAAAICDRLDGVLPADQPALLLEPSAGSGAFVRAAWNRWGHVGTIVVAHDIRPECKRDCMDNGADYWLLDEICPDFSGKADLVVGNPPFSLAERFVCESLELVREGGHVAFLLRSSFIFDGVDRADGFWRGAGACLRYVAGVAPRPSFTADGNTDGAAYVLAVWRKGWRGLPQLLPHIRWQKPARERRPRRAACPRRAA